MSLPIEGHEKYIPDCAPPANSCDSEIGTEGCTDTEES